MKNTIAATVGAVLMGCTTRNNIPDSALIVDKEVSPMSRAEVISAVNECESAGMRPLVINAKRKVSSQMTPTVVDVTCMPKYK